MAQEGHLALDSRGPWRCDTVVCDTTTAGCDATSCNSGTVLTWLHIQDGGQGNLAVPRPAQQARIHNWLGGCTASTAPSGPPGNEGVDSCMHPLLTPCSCCPRVTSQAPSSLYQPSFQARLS